MLMVTAHRLEKLGAWHWADEWEKETIYLGRDPEASEKCFAESRAMDTVKPEMGKPYRVTLLSAE